MAVGGEGGAVQDEVGGVFGCSETQLAGGVAVESPGAVPFLLQRNLEASTSRPSQPTSILTRKLVLVVACRSCRVEDQWWEGLPRGRSQ